MRRHRISVAGCTITSADRQSQRFDGITKVIRVAGRSVQVGSVVPGRWPAVYVEPDSLAANDCSERQQSAMYWSKSITKRPSVPTNNPICPSSPYRLLDLIRWIIHTDHSMGEPQYSSGLRMEYLRTTTLMPIVLEPNMDYI